MFFLKNLGYWAWQQGDLKKAKVAVKSCRFGRKLPLMKDLSLLLEQLDEFEQSHNVL